MKNLRNAFKQLDHDNTGYLTTENVEIALRQMSIPEQEINDIFKSLKHGSVDDKINYSTFLAATIDRKKTLTLQNLQFAFHHFDTTSQGHITKEDIKEVFRREGRTVSQEELDEMFGQSYVITFDHFTKTMTELLNMEN
eukprot:NODE_668_length_1526_cov_97.295193_g548_i0.p2 GENE.NODE_668_length_1526_cov_97.295193_g548_i0~~NODE_668_length_1526_cov_97.295193_g548_i0.p2  ORF type:complete len:139 (+),score=58.59 NODE_668_length_1526_cov_97.295193_g548_i0:1064-1480(+)